MIQEDNDFDFQAALKAIRRGQPLLGKEGILTLLIKNLAETALEGELDSHLSQENRSRKSLFLRRAISFRPILGTGLCFRSLGRKSWYRNMTQNYEHSPKRGLPEVPPAMREEPH